MTDGHAGGRSEGGVLVIGYGNPIRSDDGVGPRVAEAVAGWRLPGVVAVAAHQLTPELAEPVAGSRLTLFVDARLPGGAGGVESRRVGPSASARWSGHAGGPEGLLALSLAVFGRCPESWVITLPTEDLSLGEGLTPTAERGVAEALARVRSLITSDLPDP